MEPLLDNYEYDELWKEIRNDWDLDDFLENDELYNILENDNLNRFNNKLYDKIYHFTESFYENYWVNISFNNNYINEKLTLIF